MVDKTARLFQAHTNKARAKHPSFARNRFHACCILLEEVIEFLWAYTWNKDKEAARSEAGDIVAVLVRILEGDK